MAEDVGFGLENSGGFISDKVSHSIAFRHAGDGGVAHGPPPTVQVTRFTGHIDDFVFEVRVVELGVQIPIALAHAVPNAHFHAAVQDFTEVGGGVVGGADVAWDLLGHEQVLGAFAVDIRFDVQLVVKQTELDAEVKLFALFPLYVRVGRSSQCCAGIECLVVASKGIGKGVLNPSHIAQRRNAV